MWWKRRRHIIKSNFMDTTTSSSAFKEFVRSYLATAEWTSEDGEGLQVGGEYSVNALKKAIIDCRTFIKLVLDKLGVTEAAEVLERRGPDNGLMAPHDFWLTRNNHGAGFWETIDWEESVGDKLTEIAQSFEEVRLVEGDNGKLYFE